MNITTASAIVEDTLKKLLADEIDPRKARAIASLLHVHVQHAQLVLDYARLKGGRVHIPALEEPTTSNK